MEIAEDLKILLKRVCSELRKNNMQFCLAGGWAVSMTPVDWKYLEDTIKKSNLDWSFIEQIK